MPAGACSAQVRRRGDVAVVAPEGDLDGDARHCLDAAWDEAVRGDASRVLLAFAAVGCINPTGLALLVDLLARARAEQ